MIEAIAGSTVTALQVIFDTSFFPIVNAPRVTVFCVVIAFMVDRVCGEPRSFHPIVGLGLVVKAVEWATYNSSTDKARTDKANTTNTKTKTLVRGTFAALLVHALVLVLVLTLVLATALLVILVILLMLGLWVLVSSFGLTEGLVVDGFKATLAGQSLSHIVDLNIETVSLLGLYGAVSLVLYFAIAPRSLVEHIDRVYKPLVDGDLPKARTALSMVVSRDTRTLSETDTARAAIESLTENENDGVIAPLAWFLCFGLLGVVVFKTANTLDSMWGYRSKRYNYFGRFAARMDDVMGYVPARLTAFIFTYRKGLFIKAMAQGKTWYSPNAGPVMAAGALALNVSLGGGACYNGEYKNRPVLGSEKHPTVNDLGLAIGMVNNVHGSILGTFFVLGFGLGVASLKGVL